jgi:hypothetical protein
MLRTRSSARTTLNSRLTSGYTVQAVRVWVRVFVWTKLGRIRTAFSQFKAQM